MKKYLSIFCALAIALLLPQSCGSPANEAADQTVASIEKPRVPDWAKNAVLYEVNIRQFTPEGTFKAFEAHLPRLKEMGVDILWFMPIHPISKVKRKGSLGSPYAVADYYAVNPDYGTLDEFKELVKKIHNMGMYVIIDWVPNHTGWD
ncbi:MAG: alpha-amylase, partial [Deltaproteobacteria bacterium]